MLLVEGIFCLSILVQQLAISQGGAVPSFVPLGECDDVDVVPLQSLRVGSVA